MSIIQKNPIKQNPKQYEYLKTVKERMEEIIKQKQLTKCQENLHGQIAKDVQKETVDKNQS